MQRNNGDIFKLQHTCTSVLKAQPRKLISNIHIPVWERSGSVEECLTRDRRAAGSSLTGVTALWFLSKTHLS